MSWKPEKMIYIGDSNDILTFNKEYFPMWKFKDHTNPDKSTHDEYSYILRCDDGSSVRCLARYFKKLEDLREEKINNLFK